jgi:hypothetical protein
MNSVITYPFIRSELELRRDQARYDAARRPRTRGWSRRRSSRTDGNR